MDNIRIKLAIVGTRGIPARYGGFETFAQELSLRLTPKEIDVSVYCDDSKEKINLYENVNLKYASCTKDQNPLKYYKESIDLAVKDGNDIILTCGAGGSLAILYHRLHKSKAIFITNTDGIEYKRTKWNFIIRIGVRFVGEFMAVLYSNYLIADSVGIKQYLLKNYPFITPSKIKVIEYGAYIISKFNKEHLDKYNLLPNDYYLVVSRLEPENNIEMIINGFLKSKTDKKLVIIGNIKGTAYIKSLLVKKSDKVVFIGGVYDAMVLNSLRFGCMAYLHGHSVGGTNPSLLEAMGSGNIILAHDNVFNREVTDNTMFYFISDETCAEKINMIENLPENDIKEKKELSIRKVTEYYNWERIADEYLKFFGMIYKNRIIKL
ncbi:MAG: DUF1972 domain-containing protein [Prevotella sp.]|nr:DUF1972 domain-containing protein [Prevotella sp.]